MADADRDEGGKFTSVVTDTDILQAFDQSTAPVLTAAELAEDLPIGRGAVRERLLGLLDRGLLARKQVGSRAVVWWVTEDTEGSIDGIPDDDPLFSAPPVMATEPVDEDDIDEILYGEVDR